ncbi:MAG: hypothetical protein RQ745_01335 [Longimicrobiales bacterium]|nr:hypothetical protein [Longimicrobiales bacterium]
MTAALVVATAVPSAAQERYTLRGNPAIYLPAGEVEVVRGSGSEVRVSIEMRGPDANRLTVEVDEIGGRDALRVRVPGDRLVHDRGTGVRFSGGA